MALLLVALAVTAGGVANAQTPALILGLVTCQATAVPPVVRAEGIAELVGDIVLTCTNTPPAGNNGPQTQFLVTNVSVSLNVNVTNNIDFTAEDDITDAVLVINENNCTDPSTAGTVFSSCGAPDGGFQDPQFGRLANVNRLEWNRVSIPVPGAARDGFVGTADCSIAGQCFPFVTTIRITSIRGNASQLGVPGQATFPSTQITAFVSITGPTTLPVTNNVLNVAVPILGLIVEGDDVISGLQCLDTEEHGVITLKEGFATSFKTIGLPSYQPGNTQWESGYYAPGSNNGAGASQGTRFLISFFNIPEGVEIKVNEYIDHGFLNITGDALALAYVSGADSNGAGGSAVSTTDPTDTRTVSLSGGFGTVVYEVLDNNSFRVEECDVPIWVSWEADTANDLPAVGTGSFSASFAPLSTITVADADAPEPRFIDTSGDPEGIISIARCNTTLLFPFVSNQAGFDTGLAISNTSKDWLGTEPQAGACTIHYHGSTTGGGAAPPDQTSTVIAAGDQLIFTLSAGSPASNIAGAPEFQGYIIAVCEFQYGHGFAFITDGFGGVPALAQGYLALVIPVTAAAEQPRIAGVPNLHTFGEALNH
jgi:predicted ThiF/HesA family dinucleotide-utilizing enzyme